MSFDVFLAYKREDEARALRVKQALESHGFSVWWDRSLPGGETWRPKTLEYLEAAKCVVVLWTHDSVAATSGFMIDEAERGRSRGVLVPVLLDAVTPPLGFGQVQALDLVGWTGNPRSPQAEHLAATVRAKLAGEAAPFAPTGKRRPRFAPLALAGLALFAIGLAGFAGWRAWGPTAQSQEAEAVTPRLAVLRFDAIGDTPTYFAEGVADEIITEVARIPGLEVTARSSSFSLTAEGAAPQDAALQLGATVVLTGSAERASDSIRVRVQLVSTRDGRQLWSRTFERPHEHIYELQREIALEVGHALGLRVQASPSRRVNRQAYELYIRAREQLEKGPNEPGDVIALLLRSVELDENYAAAWSLLARAELFAATNLVFENSQYQINEVDFRSATQAAERAMALDPNLAEPYATKAQIALWLGRWQDAMDMQELASARGSRYARVFLETGQLLRFASLAQGSAELNPLSPRAEIELYLACSSIGNDTCALEAIERTFTRSPSEPEVILMFIFSLVDAREIERARSVLQASEQSLQRVNELYPPIDRRHIEALLGLGPPRTASEITASVLGGQGFVSAAVLMLIDLGHVEAAAALLPHWSERHQLYSLYARKFAPLHKHPNFWALMEREGLLAFWRDSGRWPDLCAESDTCAPYGGPSQPR